ncbi:unnamed protein product [Lymnaea stagnalis]|uniref:J domain-containing protein n=1 Tax=Lymnaea stagnalis TaxID=6523 RepID=A0AAV2IMA2_LYMST
MSKQHHPDVSECQNSHSLFTEINEAYEVLGNLRKRRMYDRGLYSSPTVHQQRADSTQEDTEENEDYTQAYRNSNFKRGSRPPPPRGHTKIYNFDEFYRQHYNDMRERKRKATEFEEYKRHQEGRIKSTNFAMDVLVLLWMFAAFSLVILRRENYDRDMVGQKKTPGTSHGGNNVASSPRSRD